MNQLGGYFNFSNQNFLSDDISEFQSKWNNIFDQNSSRIPWPSHIDKTTDEKVKTYQI